MKKSRNPYSGRNSSGYRFRFQVSSIARHTLFLPLEMKSLQQIQLLMQGVSPLSVFNCQDEARARQIFRKIRIQYDFDYWAVNEYFIRDLKDADSIIPLRLNDAQFIVIDTFRKRYFDRLQSRYIISKSFRRCGLSTCIQAYILWMQTYHCANNSYTCCPSEISMFPLKSNLCRFLHRDVIPHDMGIYLPNVDRCAFFNTFRSPDAIRGINLGYVHLADMSRWRDPGSKLTTRAFAAPVSAVLLKYFTLVVLEGDVPSKGSFSINEFFEQNPHIRESARKNNLSKFFRNPFFINEVMASRSSPSPHFFYLHLPNPLQPLSN